jgi:hypothetical protein
MLADLEHLIHLQQLDDASEEARQRLDEMPSRHAALDASAAEADGRVAEEKQRLNDAQGSRRELEKQLAEVQGRLSKYKDQLMLVKTNKEYQAMQHEIATAEHDVRTREDRILEHMEVAETQTRLVKEAESIAKQEQAAVGAEQQAMEREKAELESQIERLARERDALRLKAGGEALRLFDHLAKQRKGIAIVEARDGHCAFCHVRLRPQVFNEIRRNDKVVQCDSCLRILYYQERPGEAAGA